MKKIIPILTLIGASSLMVGGDLLINKQQGINANLKEELSSSLAKIKQNPNSFKIVGNKYLTSLSTPTDATLVDSDNFEVIGNKTDNSEQNFQDNSNSNNPSDPNLTLNDFDNYAEVNKSQQNPTTNEENQEKNTPNLEIEINENKILNNNQDEISTLYSLSDDVNNCCEEYSQLKENLTNAINETQSILTKINNGEIVLTTEQKKQLADETIELRKLSKQLAQSTNQLAFSVSDLNNFINSSGNYDDMSIKYLIVLNNLLNSNEMLETGLETLNNLNNIFYSYNAKIPENSRGRIMYGYRKNNEDPIIKDYYISENGELIDNQNKEENSQDEENDKPHSTIDTYKNTNFHHNIDTYGNYNQNTDTFFNTALLDNEFMYGAPYGRAGFGMYGNNPYLNQYNQYQTEREINNTTNGKYNINNTQDIEKNKTSKKFKLKKNVDTYRNDNTPNLKTKFENFKNWFTGKNPKLKDNIENPIYRIDENN